MTIKALNKIPIATIHQAFLEAFADYAVPIQMPLPKFREMMQTRDLNPEYSFGYFNNDRLIGFILCGYREIDNRKYCYDGGTGIVKDFRRQGIGNTLLRALIADFGRKGIHGLLLEVLEHNHAALDLYLKNGFQKTRRFKCFERERQEMKSDARTVQHPYAIDTDIGNYRRLDCTKYLTFKPSWQNDRISIANAAAHYEYVAVALQNEVIGYGLIHKISGDIPQIGIRNEGKDQGLEALIVANLVKRTQSERIAFLNVEENDYLEAKLVALGFRNFVNQYEMKLDFERYEGMPQNHPPRLSHDNEV